MGVATGPPEVDSQGCPDRLCGGSRRNKAGTRARWLRAGAAPRGQGGEHASRQDDLNRQLEAPQQQENLNRQFEALQRDVSASAAARNTEAAAAQPPPEPEPRRPSRRCCCSPACWSSWRRPAGSWSARSPGPRPTRRRQGRGHRRLVPPRAPTPPPLAQSPRRRVRRRWTGTTRSRQRRRAAEGAGRVRQDHEPIVHSQPLRPRGGRKIAPSLQAGASESTRFDQASANYRQVVDQCKLRTP